MTDLDAMAAEETAKKKSGPPCWACSIPEREWVDAQKGKRSMPVIVAVLVRNGHPAEMATLHRIKSHMANHVR